MSSAEPPPVLMRPSVFISYASEDRAAARELRDILATAGLEVWYDENELGGGDAWDQKIRRQIRDCDYFMPVISATTNRRKEGYFRREWRLATERTMDMADDVLFLLPVTIDDTNETNARVPERFLTVQWLRVPGGRRTPTLDSLIQRLLAGDHTPLTRPPMAFRPKATPLTDASESPDRDAAPPKMPPFPHPLERGGIGHWIKFFAEVLWWFVTAMWSVMIRLPRWARVLIGVWLIITAIGTCRDRGPSRPKGNEPPPPHLPPDRRDPNRTGERAPPPPMDKADAAAMAARRKAKSIDPNAAGMPLVLVPFSREIEVPEASRFAAAVFAACSERLRAVRAEDVAVTQASAGATDDALVILGRNLGAGHILGASLTTAAEKPALAVRFIRVGDGSITWSGTYPITGSDPAQVGASIAEAVLQSTSRRKKG